ncbi:MAG: hypothetical protein Q4P78_02405 [Rothia sp. (in: high G+C Gram-positive bacteria)]|uniref:hypothetical protein n=1 Tax=Rothia sp. (in: high G+C Gram-positive bacteria) TaxID=1885016 RepID=UPI0026DF510A|nr:hypothetical protein [Rothia sp. (in: high G+C Gram-positive bacteria)]MDO5750039.1 hypothetical protein [Rothia sp. (in: high G+C Gram-positive bacteria)]
MTTENPLNTSPSDNSRTPEEASGTPESTQELQVPQAQVPVAETNTAQSSTDRTDKASDAQNEDFGTFIWDETAATYISQDFNVPYLEQLHETEEQLEEPESEPEEDTEKSNRKSKIASIGLGAGAIALTLGAAAGVYTMTQPKSGPERSPSASAPTSATVEAQAQQNHPVHTEDGESPSRVKYSAEDFIGQEYIMTNEVDGHRLDTYLKFNADNTCTISNVLHTANTEYHNRDAFSSCKWVLNSSSARIYVTTVFSGDKDNGYDIFEIKSRDRLHSVNSNQNPYYRVGTALAPGSSPYARPSKEGTPAAAPSLAISPGSNATPSR